MALNQPFLANFGTILRGSTVGYHIISFGPQKTRIWIWYIFQFANLAFLNRFWREKMGVADERAHKGLGPQNPNKQKLVHLVNLLGRLFSRNKVFEILWGQPNKNSSLCRLVTCSMMLNRSNMMKTISENCFRKTYFSYLMQKLRSK